MVQGLVVEIELKYRIAVGKAFQHPKEVIIQGILRVPWAAGPPYSIMKNKSMDIFISYSRRYLLSARTQIIAKNCLFWNPVSRSANLNVTP